MRAFVSGLNRLDQTIIVWKYDIESFFQTTIVWQIDLPTPILVRFWSTMAQSNRVRKPHLLITSFLNLIDLCHGSKSFGRMKIVWQNDFGGTSIVVQNELPPPVLVRFGSTMARLKPLDKLDLMITPALNDGDLCQRSKIVPQHDRPFLDTSTEIVGSVSCFQTVSEGK